MLEPAMIPFIRDTEAFFPPGAADLPVVEQRRLYDAYCAAFTPPRPPGMAVEEAALDLDDRRIPLRLYRPAEPPAGTIVYLHGGGFTLGSLDSHDLTTARLAADAQAVVVAVDYRLAPEHPAPAAFEDGLAVADAALAGRLGLPLPVVLAGDSAGGLLAAGAALALRDRGGPQPAGLALIYPALARDPAPPACRDEAEAPMLTLAEVRACFAAYFAARPPGRYDLPLAADRFDGLPPSFLLPVEHDPLRDDAGLFAERVRAAGGHAELRLGRGLVHGCLRALGRSPEMEAAFGDLVRFVRWCFARSDSATPHRK